MRPCQFRSTERCKIQDVNQMNPREGASLIQPGFEKAFVSGGIHGLQAAKTMPLGFSKGS